MDNSGETQSLPNLNAEALKAKVSELSSLILDKHPRMPVLLRDIHNTLRNYPENVTLLAEEEICTIVQGLVIQTGVEFAAAVTKSPSASKSVNAKIKSMGADAF